jgi:hypothetical protein
MRITGFELYGGATITRAVDGAGHLYIGCCARRTSDQLFGFWVFRDGVPLELETFCTGRGSINNAGVWVAWTNKDYYIGQIPGFVPHPPSAAPWPGKSTVIAAPDDPLWSGDPMRIVQVLEYYGLIERPS